MEQVSVGIIGAGFAADVHVRNLNRVRGVRLRVDGVAATSYASAKRFAEDHRIPNAYGSYTELLASDVDVVSVAVPNALHERVILDAVEAGKHVICEKPLTSAFGVSGEGVARAEAEWAQARASVARIEAALARGGVALLYGENWVYAPAVSRIKELLATSGGSILDIRAEVSHSGSHAPRTRRRATAGGGALLTLGAHAVSTALHLKAFEGGLPGRRPAAVESVTADLAALQDSPAFAAGGSHDWIVRDWEDVETWANLVIAFSDGSRAVINASFAMLGGVRNIVEVYTTNAAYRSTITPSSDLMAFTADPAAFDVAHLPEKLESRTGWIASSPDEDWSRGYQHELQDFMDAIVQRRAPLSGLSLARETLDVIYAGYVSAARGERVTLPIRGLKP